MVAAFVEPVPASSAVEWSGGPWSPSPLPPTRRAAPGRRPPAPVVPIDVARRRCHGPSPAQLRRRRTTAVGLVLMILLGVFVAPQALFGRPAGATPHASGSAGTVALAGRAWVVRPGDTLWTIALATGARGDIRPLVARMSAEVGGQPLQPGERIVVP
jgi:hypothetical protein